MPMCSARDNAALPALGCPIRESAGQRPFSASPRLIAAVHALHRLLVPRHPPYALTILTVIRSDANVQPGDTRSFDSSVQFSRSAERQLARVPAGQVPVPAAGAGLSKLDSMRWRSRASSPDSVDMLGAGRPGGRPTASSDAP